MTTENPAANPRPDIVALDARVVQATVGVVSRPPTGDAGILDQIVAMLGRSPSWPR